MGMEINIDRLMTNLFEMAKIGMNEQGGIDRRWGAGQITRPDSGCFLIGKEILRFIRLWIRLPICG